MLLDGRYLRAMLVARRRRRDERAEDRTLPVGVEKMLRVPLHAEREGVGHAFDGLDHAARVAGRDADALAQAVHRSTFTRMPSGPAMPSSREPGTISIDLRGRTVQRRSLLS